MSGESVPVWRIRELLATAERQAANATQPIVGEHLLAKVAVYRELLADAATGHGALDLDVMDGADTD